MSINLAEIQQKIDRLIFNIAEQNRRAYQLFYDPNPQDVELPQLDENGNLITVKIPNRAKIKAEVDNFIAGAEATIKGWWKESFSVATAVELRDAIESVPNGGYGSIALKEDIELDSDISVTGKRITIFLNGKKIVRPSTLKGFLARIRHNGVLVFFGDGVLEAHDTGESSWWLNGMFCIHGNGLLQIGEVTTTASALTVNIGVDNWLVSDGGCPAHFASFYATYNLIDGKAASDILQNRGGQFISAKVSNNVQSGITLP